MTSPNAICDCRTVNDQGGPPRFWPCPVHGEGTPAAPARCRTCGFTDCPGATTPGGCTRWPGTEANTSYTDYAGLTFLSYAQLTDALSASNDEYDRRFEDFMDTCRAAKTGALALDEAKAEMDTRYAAVKAQADMTRVITAEITARIRRHDYA